MDLKTSILEGEFQVGLSLIKNLSIADQMDEFNLIAFETGKVEVYFFILSIISKNETAGNHYMAAEILSTALCHIPGAYYAAYYHAKKASELSPNDISYLEHLLLYYSIPEKLIADDEALLIANVILEMDKNNTTAKTVKDTVTTKVL